MFNQRPTPESQFDAEMKRILSKLNQAEPDSEEYGKLLEKVSKLHKMQMEDRSDDSPTRKPLSPDTVLGVAANIFGILWLTRYEKEHVINSKALNFVLRPRS